MPPNQTNNWKTRPSKSNRVLCNWIRSRRLRIIVRRLSQRKIASFRYHQLKISQKQRLMERIRPLPSIQRNNRMVKSLIKLQRRQSMERRADIVWPLIRNRTVLMLPSRRNQCISRQIKLKRLMLKAIVLRIPLLLHHLPSTSMVQTRMWRQMHLLLFLPSKTT